MTISLSPLSADNTARLIGELLDQSVLPADVQQGLLARAEGNPLYAQGTSACCRIGACWSPRDAAGR
jgi:predicted ATPase